MALTQGHCTPGEAVLGFLHVSPGLPLRDIRGEGLVLGLLECSHEGHRGETGGTVGTVKSPLFLGRPFPF